MSPLCLECNNPYSMRIVHIFLWSNSTFSGGVPRAVLDRTRFLASHGHDVTILTRGHDDWHQAHEIDGVKVRPLWVRDLKMRRFGLHPPALLHRIKRAIWDLHRESPIDIIDTHDGPVRLAINGFVRRTKVPHCFTIHSDPIRRPDDMKGFAKWYYGWTDEMSRSRADAVAGVSRFILSLDPKLRDAKKSQVVYNPAPQDALDYEVPPFAKRNELRILFPHRMVIEKGWKDLLGALSATRHRDRIRLTMAGSGPDEAAVKSAIEELGLSDIVTYVGQVGDRADMLRLLATHDVYAIPTYFEAFSIGLLEAMAMGRCCLASDLGCNLEALADSGVTYPVGDVAQLAERLDTLAINPELVQSKQSEARTRAQNFTAEKCLSELPRVYESIVSP